MLMEAKPMASTSEQAMRLIDEAASRNLVLMVDHTFCLHRCGPQD